jgi:hypothetical protein
MEKIQFDSGIREYKLNGAGVLRFNPGDPNLYARFMDAAQKIQDIEKELAAQAREEGASVVALLQTADRKMKETLSWVFGPGNDFDKVLSYGETALRDMLLAWSGRGAEGLFFYQSEKDARAALGGLTSGQLLELYDLFSRCRKQLSYNVNLQNARMALAGGIYKIVI